VTPIAKNIRVVRGTGLPDGATYPRRARQLVRHGRAEWLDATTVRLHLGSPGKRAENTETAYGSDEAIAHFKQLVDKVVSDDDLTNQAIAGIVEACKQGVSQADAPAHAIGRIMEANRQLKIEALKILHEFITVHQ